MDPERRYWLPIVGNNFRMTNLQAAIGVAQLEQMSCISRNGGRSPTGTESI